MPTAVAQRVAGQQRGGGRHRAVDAERRARRRRLGMGIRNLENAAGNIELAPGRHFDGAAAEIDGRGAAGDADGEIGVADRRQTSIGRRVVPLVSISTESPSSGVGGPLALNVGSGALPAITTRSTVPPEICSSTQSRTSARGEHRPQPLHHRHRHAGAGDAEGQMRLGAGIIQAAGDGDADIVRRPRVDAAEIALIEIDALARRIDARAHCRPVERKAFLVGRCPAARMTGSITGSPRVTLSSQAGSGRRAPPASRAW